MKTSKPFATISYNSIPFLRSKLDDFVAGRIIDFYAFIDHYPEEDETKAHRHLFVIPNGRLDTDSFFDQFLEVDPDTPDLPFRCIKARPSKFQDWYLYCLHDSSYLALKGQARKFHYLTDDFYVSDGDYFLELIHEIDHAKLFRFDGLREAVEKGISFEDLLFDGFIPVQMVTQYRMAYEMMMKVSFSRAGRSGHE